MNQFYPGLLFSIFIGILLISGCNKEDPEIIVYPVTLTYDGVTELTDWVAYKNQSGTAVEVNPPSATTSDPDLMVPSGSEVLVSIKLISETTAEITDDTETKTATYINVGNAFQFSINDDTFGTLTLGGSGDEKEMTFDGRSYYESDVNGSISVNGICVEFANESLHCGAIDLVDFASSTSEGAVVVFRDFKIKFTAD